jgi:hypothetical protein
LVSQVAVFEFVPTAFANSSWLTGWGYRKSHVINNAAGAGTLYQTQITVHYAGGTDADDDVYLNISSRLDFGDVRFTDDDGSTLLDYWMESKVDSDNAVFWVEVADDLSTTNQSIFIYYENATATTTSNFTNTFKRIIDAGTPTILALPIDEGSGTVTYDKSGNGNNGTLLPVGSEPTWVDGKYGKALLFDGIDDGVQLPAAVSRAAGDFTISMWVNVTTVEAYVYCYTEGSTISNTPFIVLGLGASSQLWFSMRDNTVSVVSISGAVPTAGVWYHLTVTRSGNVFTFYINGVSVDTKTTAINAITVNSFYLGKFVRASESAQFNGVIDEVRIYNRALTQDEITDIYNNYLFEVKDNTESVGKGIIRKYVSPEPSHGSWGSEETSGYALNLRVMDWDLTDAISGAIVYKDTDTKTSNGGGWANWTGVSGTVAIKVKYFGFWVNGTSVTMNSDKTINVQCKLYDVTVTAKPNNEIGVISGANVTAYNNTGTSNGKIKSGITVDTTGQVTLTNIPNATLRFIMYAKSDYSIIIANTTQLISSDDYSFNIVANQNYVTATLSFGYEAIIWMSSLSILHLLGIVSIIVHKKLKRNGGEKARMQEKHV